MEPFAPKRILVPVDLSAASAPVLRWARLFAAAFGARVHVLHADWWEPPWYFTEAQLQTLVAQAQANRATVREQLRALAADTLGPEIPYELVVVEGHPVQQIRTYAQQWTPDLIVLGSHGHTGLARLRLGSVAEDVVRQALQPVLIVKSLKEERAPSLRQILCPVNFTGLAQQCLEVSAAVAAAFRARLLMAYAVESQPPDLLQTRERLCAWVPGTVRDRCELVEVVRQGDAAEQILLLAREQSVDLVAIGARHRPLLEWTTWGATTERVVRHSPVSVLVVPRPRDHRGEQ